MLKRFLYFILGISFLLSSCGIFDRSDEKVVMTVGKRHITTDQFKRDIKYITSGMGIMDQGLKHVTGPLIDKMVDHYLILEYGRQNEITFDKKELESAVKDIKKDYPENVFEEMLLHRYVDFEEWKEILRQQLFIKKIIKTVSENIRPISFDEIKAYFNSHRKEFMHSQMVKFRQVVTKTRNDAEKILERSADGERLDELAKRYSITPEAEYGGEVGWIAKGELEESMEKAIFSLPVGKISPVMKTPYGYHVFEVLAKRSAGYKTLPEAMEEIESILFHQKEVSYYQKWLQELRGIFPVKVNEELLKKLEFG